MLWLNFNITHTVLIYIYVHTLKNKGVRTSNIQLYKIIVRCEQRDGPPRPSAYHVTGRFKKKSFLYLDLYVLGDDALISKGSFM